MRSNEKRGCRVLDCDKTDVGFFIFVVAKAFSFASLISSDLSLFRLDTVTVFDGEQSSNITDIAT